MLGRIKKSLGVWKAADRIYKEIFGCYLTVLLYKLQNHQIFINKKKLFKLYKLVLISQNDNLQQPLKSNGFTWPNKSLKFCLILFAPTWILGLLCAVVQCESIFVYLQFDKNVTQSGIFELVLRHTKIENSYFILEKHLYKIAELNLRYLEMIFS